MLEQLEKLINFIIEQYSIIDIEWKQSEILKPINMKKILVKNLYLEEYFVDNIIYYRLFINEKNLKINLQIENLGLKSRINTRVKA